MDYFQILQTENLAEELPKLTKELELDMSVDTLQFLGSHKTGTNESMVQSYMDQLDAGQRKLLLDKVYKSDYLMLKNYYSYKYNYIILWRILFLK